MTKNVGVRLEDHDGRDRVTKNVGNRSKVGARSEHCDGDQKRRRCRSRVREKLEQCDSDQKRRSKSEQGRSKVGAEYDT